MFPQVTHDPEANAAYIRFSAARIVESEEVSPGVVLDFDAEGRIVGMELLDAEAQLPKDLVTKAA
jgi:uncharacterized protein YuzE